MRLRGGRGPGDDQGQEEEAEEDSRDLAEKSHLKENKERNCSKSCDFRHISASLSVPTVKI